MAAARSPSTTATTSSRSAGTSWGSPSEVHAWIGETPRAGGGTIDAPGIISWKFPGNRYGHLELVYSPDLEIVTIQYPQDDRLEITGTSGVIAISRGHGRIIEGPAVTLHSGGQLRGFQLPRRRARLGGELHPFDEALDRGASERHDASPHRRGGARHPEIHARRAALGRARPRGSGRRGGPAHAMNVETAGMSTAIVSKLRSCGRFRFKPYSRQGVAAIGRHAPRLGWWYRGAVAK